MFEAGGGAPHAGRGVFTRRAAVVGLVQIAGLGLLASRLYQLQVVDQNRYGQLADANRISRLTL
ncbi:MAG: penicillin-binding protein 2, partial [Alphaproteobacteria bacterium]